MHSETRPVHNYESFEVLVGPGTPDHYRITVLHSPAGEATGESFFDVNDFTLHEALVALQAKDVDERFLEQFGQFLFEELFVGDVETLYRTSLGIVRGQDKYLRIHLRFDAPELAVLPWEYLFDAKEERFLARSAETVVVRYIPIRLPIRPLSITSPLRVLVVIASPTDLAPLDSSSEESHLRQALAEPLRSGQVQLEILKHGTLTAISEAMRTVQPHIFHFVGHGCYVNDEAHLVLEDGQGASAFVDERTFRELFVDCRDTRLVVLNACETGTTSAVQPMVGMAPRLLQRQVSAVVAMQAEVLDDTALVFTRVFYRCLALGFPVDAATAEARRAIFLEMGANSGEWGVPVLFMRAQDGHLFNISQPEIAQEVRIEPPPKPIQPPQPAGFVGRQAELTAYRKQLRANHVVVISGMAGIGKTSLAVTLANGVTEDRPYFWHTFHEADGADTVIWALAGWLAWQGQDEVWRMVQNARIHGGEPPPTQTLLDYLLQLLGGYDYLLCLDDAHLVEADPILKGVIVRLVTAAEQGQFDLILTTRRRLSFSKAMAIVPLEGLVEEDARKLLAEQQVQLTEAQLTALHQTTGGNVALLILATNLLVPGEDFTHRIAQLDKTEDVEHYLLVEVDNALDDDERSVMGAVALLQGYPGSSDAVEVILDRTDGLEPVLAGLAGRHLLNRGDGADRRTYTQHAILQGYYYRALSRWQRRTMHQRAGEYYEFVDVDLLKAARHFDQAGDHDHAAALVTAHAAEMINQGEAQALYHLLLALATRSLSADRKFRLLETQGDVEYLLGKLEQAAHTFADSAARAGDGLSQARLLRKLGEVQMRLGEYEQALATFARGRGQLEAVSDAQTEDARLVVGIATTLLNQGKYAQARTLATATLEAPGQHIAPEVTAELYDILGKTYFFETEYQAAIAQFQLALELRQGQEDQRGTLKSYSNLANVYGSQHRYPDSADANQAALTIAEHIGDQIAICTLYTNIAVDYMDMGHYEIAIAYHMRSLDLAEQMGHRQGMAHAHFNLGVAYRTQGKAPSAIIHLSRAAELASDLGEQTIVVGARRELAEAYLQQNLTDKALDECYAALELEKDSDIQFWRPQVLASLGEIQRRRHQLAEARATFAEAAPLLQTSGTAVEQAMLFQNWSRLEEELGDLVRAYELCLNASQMMRHADTTGLAEEITSRMRQLSSSINSGGQP